MVASVLFLFSFGTNSLLVFYVLPFVDYVFRQWKYIFSSVGGAGFQA